MLVVCHRDGMQHERHGVDLYAALQTSCMMTACVILLGDRLLMAEGAAIVVFVGVHNVCQHSYLAQQRT